MSTNTSSFALKKHESTDNVVTALTTNQNANMEAIEDLLDGTTNDADLTPILQSGTKIADTSRDHEYTVAVSELAADRTVTLPLLAGNDDFVFEDHTQTMTNKTMTSPVINVTSDARSDIYFRNASGAFSRLAAGTANYPLVTNGASADPAYEQLSATGIADNAVTTAKINSDAVTGAKIADDALDSEHYTDGSIDTAHLAADAVTGAKIADDALDSEHYTDASIDAAHIASNAVTTAKVNADAITGAKIADDALDSEHYTDGSIDTAHIADNQVTLAKLADATQGDVLYYGSSGAPAVLSAGTDGYFLKTQGGSANPVWAAAGGGGMVQQTAINAPLTSGTTTSTSYVDVPSSDGQVTLTTTGGDLLVWYSAVVRSDTDNQYSYVAIEIDGGSEVAESRLRTADANVSGTYVGFHRFTSVSSASHTVSMRWRVAGNTSTMEVYGGIIMQEIS